MHSVGLELYSPPPPALIKHSSFLLGISGSYRVGVCDWEGAHFPLAACLRRGAWRARTCLRYGVPLWLKRLEKKKKKKVFVLHLTSAQRDQGERSSSRSPTVSFSPIGLQLTRPWGSSQ